MRTTRQHYGAGRSNAGRIVLAAAALPVATRVLRKIGQQIANRQGNRSGLGNSVQRAASGLDYFSRRQQHGMFGR